MTAVVEIQGKHKARARVFLDPGAQASFISAALVDTVEGNGRHHSAGIWGTGSGNANERLAATFGGTGRETAQGKGV